jgi:alanine dehydrogenase
VLHNGGNGANLPTFRTKLLSNRDVEKLLSFEEVVNAVEKTWSEDARGRVVNPAKLSLDLGESGAWPSYSGYMNAMPAYVGWLDMAGLKWAGGFWDNASLGIPSIWGLILLIDPRTGVFKAVIDGTLITSLRTAAQSVVGIKHIARKRFNNIGIYGAGTQVRFHVLMFSEFFKEKELRVYDVRRDAVEKLVQDIAGKTGAKIVTCRDPQECAQSDVVLTLTNSKTPFLRAEWVRDGQLIMALGSYQEVYPDAITKARKIVVDHPVQAIHRGALKILAEDKLISEKDIYATIGDIIAGLKPGREKDDEIIFFEPVGTGMLDVAVAGLAFEKAAGKGLGQDFEFFRL